MCQWYSEFKFVKREYFQGLEDQRLSGILSATHVPAVTSCGVKVGGSGRRGGAWRRARGRILGRTLVGGGFRVGANGRLSFISLSIIDLLLCDASESAAFHRFCALSF